MPAVKRPYSALEQSVPRDPAPYDHDPEDLPSEYSQSDEDASDSDDGGPNGIDGGREHYESVSKSKLRSRDTAALGPQYAGSRVSRNAFKDTEGSEHDPFADGFGDSTSDEEDQADDTDGGVEIDTSGSEIEDGKEDGTGTDATSLSSASDVDEEIDDDDEDAFSDENQDAMGGDPARRRAGGGGATKSTIDRSALRDIMNNENKSVAASLNAANEADAEKGRAIKKQRKLYDGLLNTRIRLQQGLGAANALHATASQQEDHAAYKGAEEAALNLWNSLNTLRQQLVPEESSQAPPKPFKAAASTSLGSLWSQMSIHEAQAMPHRNTVLAKWSQKTATLAQSTQTQTKNRLTGGPAAQPTVLDILQTQHLVPSNIARLVTRSRSKASQTSDDEDVNGSTTTKAVTYDDADFYASLLRELIDSRNAVSLSSTLPSNLNADTTSTTANLDAQAALRTAQRAAKQRRPVVDTKASKGRKLKYTVHEKLQNFMAPEERGTWGERQREELFRGLFGGGDVHMNGTGEEREDGDEGREEEALRLFRT